MSYSLKPALMWLASALPLLQSTTMNNLTNWDLKEQEKRVIFMEHMYACSGRQDPAHPLNHRYTGLWQDFCIREAGYAMRDRWFEMQEAIRRVEAGELQPTFISEGLQ